MKNKIYRLIPTILLVSLVLAGFSGCSTYNEYKQLPPDQRQAFLKDKAIEFLSDDSVQKSIENSIVLAGIETLQRATSDDERTEICKQMYATAVAFNSLATGKILTADEIKKTVQSFSPNAGAGYATYIAQLSIIWDGIEAKLKIGQTPQLIIDYAVLFGRAAQRSAATFIPPEK